MTSNVHRIDLRLDSSDVRRGVQDLRQNLQQVDNAVDNTSKKATQKVGLIGRAFNNLKSQIVSMSGALGGLSAGLAAFQAVNTIASFGDQMASVRAVTLATDAEFQKLRQTALDLGQARFGAKEVGEGLELLARAGLSADESVKTVNDTLKLAQAENLSLAEATDYLAKITQGMRLGFDQTNRVANVLAATASATATDVRELGAAFSYAAAISSSFNTPIEQLAAAFGILANNGIKADRAGTGIVGILSRIAAPTKEFEKDLKKAGLTLADINPEANSLVEILGKMAKANLTTSGAFEIFRQRAGNAAEVLVHNVDQVTALESKIKSLDKNLDLKFDIKQDTLLSDLFKVLSAVNALIIALGDAGLERVLRTVAQLLAATFRGLAATVNALVPVVQNLAIGFAIAFSPQLLAGFAVGLLSLVRIFGLLTGAALAAGRAVLVFALANPFTAIAVAIGLVISATSQWGDEIRVVGTQYATLSDVISVVGDRISGIFSGIASIASTVFTSVVQFAVDAANAIVAVFEKAANGIIAALNSIGTLTGIGEIGKFASEKISAADLVPSFAKSIVQDAEIKGLDRAEKARLDGILSANALAKSKQHLTEVTKASAAAEEVESKSAHETKTARQELLEAINGPASTALANMAALNELFAQGQVTASEFADQLQRLRGQLLSNDQTVTGGILKGLNSVAEGATKIGDNIAQTIQGIFSNASNAIADFATSGKFDFKSLTDSILKDLVRLATNQLFGQIVNGALGALGQGASGVGGLGGGGLGGAIGDLLGFARGGAFIVGGSGGTDSQMVAFKATPGEEVAVRTPQQQGAGGGATTVNVFNNSGAQVQEKRRRDGNGNEVVEIVIGEVDRAMAGGRFDRSQRTRYSAAPARISR